MTVLWTKMAISSAITGEIIGDCPNEFTGISIDSRTIKQNEIFFCIQGENLDGHDYAKKAHQAGAALLVIAKDKYKTLQHIDAPFLVVADVLKALEQLAIAARARTKAKIIAVTGSVGKTTTKEALRHCLAEIGLVHASPASFNNHWGVPLTLARMPENTDFGIFEIGMNHENEIRPLVKMVKPDIAIITRIAPVHLGHFANLTAIADAKAEIFEGVVKNGTVLLNADDEYFSYLQDKAKALKIKNILSFGEADFANYRIENLHMQPDCSCLTIAICDQQAMVKIGAPGRHIVQNALAVIGTCDYLQVDMAKIVLALAKFSPEAGRGSRYQLTLPKGGVFTLIDESYNANPTSMRAALSLLKGAEIGPRGRRIAVLGDMLELGKFSKTLHLGLAEAILKAGINPLFLVGKEIKPLSEQLSKHLYVQYRHNVDEILPLVLKEISNGDVVMVKSSNSIRSSLIVAALLKYCNAQAA